MTLVFEDPLRHDGAAYRPAAQPWYSQFVRLSTAGSRTQGRLALCDFDLLSGSGLATFRHFLQSAPNGLRHRRCMVSERNRFVCEGLADSGGYQISTGKLKLSERNRLELLRYSEKFAAACILDAPTSTIGRPGSGFHSMKDCLEFTVDSILYAMRNRDPGRTCMLNVSQGRSPKELADWFAAVKGYNDRRTYGERALEGWASAGVFRLRFSYQLPILVELRDDHLIRAGAYIHTLGTGHPEVACALTAVQDGLRETLAEDITVSFDNATPFLLAGEYKKALGSPSLTRQKLHVPVVQMPQDERYVGSDQPWPCRSPFADRLTLGDLNMRRGHPKTPWDAYSHVMLAAHNVWVLGSAIAEVNHRLRLDEGNALNWLPGDLVAMTQVIREVFHSEQPMKLIRQNAKLLDRLGDRSRNTTMIDDPNEDDR